MKVYLPEKMNRATMYNFINEIIDDDRQPKADSFEFMFNTLKFIEPVGVTVLSNITEWLIDKGIDLEYTYPKINYFEKINSMCYLDDSLYFERYLNEKIRPNAEPRPTTIPLTLVTINESYQWFQKVIFWMSGKLGITTESLADYKMCFQEIFNNINDHSTEHIGCAFIQHYPKENKICIAISDFGVGIPYNLQKLHPSLNDAQAIKEAVKQGISTKSTPRNRGAGLDTLIHNVVLNNMGSVYIHSNYGILECKYKNEGIQMSSRLKRVFYPGTLIEINLRTDTIENILNDREDFAWD
ncbi:MULTISPECIES: hypothetical protein [Paenibacillus]|uniref:hypothetical protein n=1 Tax=Paenibacillus TaxID=44249 RepID=UPI00096F2EAF|nr:hypothetical protein [Paenibacillus odorifer]OME18783.1 hypothetical protein BSK60_01715 [Paenibacillus odorifer]